MSAYIYIISIDYLYLFISIYIYLYLFISIYIFDNLWSTAPLGFPCLTVLLPCGWPLAWLLPPRTLGSFQNHSTYSFNTFQWSDDGFGLWLTCDVLQVHDAQGLVQLGGSYVLQCLTMSYSRFWMFLDLFLELHGPWGEWLCVAPFCFTCLCHQEIEIAAEHLVNSLGENNAPRLRFSRRVPTKSDQSIGLNTSQHILSKSELTQSVPQNVAVTAQGWLRTNYTALPFPVKPCCSAHSSKRLKPTKPILAAKFEGLTRIFRFQPPHHCHDATNNYKLNYTFYTERLSEPKGWPFLHCRRWVSLSCGNSSWGSLLSAVGGVVTMVLRWFSCRIYMIPGIHNFWADWNGPSNSNNSGINTSQVSQRQGGCSWSSQGGTERCRHCDDQ